jgi:SAM-dependent methyltransferase
MSKQHKRIVKDKILDENTFVRAVFGGQRRGHVVPWNRVVVRPVSIKGQRHVQFSYFDATKDITKNYVGAQVIERLDELLALPFKNITLQTTGEDFQFQITRKGKVTVHRHELPEPRELPSLQHDRRKNLLLPSDKPDPFLQQIGVMTAKGQVRASMQKKFRQINEFLECLVGSGELEKFEQSPLSIVDCGCGSAHLSFAVYHYLNHVLGMPARLTGVDTNEDVLQKQVEQSRALGWSDLNFEVARIVDFQPAAPPDVVLALHACDTATDEALAQGVKWRSRLILSAPCCHHHLQRQINRQSAPPQFRPVLRHGVLKERIGDILTDAFRALILRIVGYRTDVVEFVSTEHTGKNLMIRAVRSGQVGDLQDVREYAVEYRALKEFWQVTPYLERLLQAELVQLGINPATA